MQMPCFSLWFIGLALAGGGLAAEVAPPLPLSAAEAGRFPQVEIMAVMEPPGESNVRSSFRLADGVALVGTEETGDIYKTSDYGESWTKVWDGGDTWGIQDVRNYVRGQDGHIYITTSEPALVARSQDEGESWDVLVRPKSSRTVGLVELDDGTQLVGLRRSENQRISIVRSTDRWESFDWIKVDADAPRQNVTCFGYWGGDEVLAGVGFEASGKVYLSRDRGLTWKRTGEFPAARDLMDFFQHDSGIYVLASGVATLYRSEDEGRSWGFGRQFWEEGFLGMAVPYLRGDKQFWLMSATDQTMKPYRHVILISDNPAGDWFEWVELDRDDSGGASNLAVLSSNVVIAGTGNHSAQGRAYTLRVMDE